MTDIELKDGSEMEKQGAAELRKEDQREDGKMDRERIRLEMDSLSKNEEFARVVAAVFMSRLNKNRGVRGSDQRGDSRLRRRRGKDFHGGQRGRGKENAVHIHPG